MNIILDPSLKYVVMVPTYFCTRLKGI